MAHRLMSGVGGNDRAEPCEVHSPQVTESVRQGIPVTVSLKKLEPDSSDVRERARLNDDTGSVNE